jgi:hypothetical protein
MNDKRRKLLRGFTGRDKGPGVISFASKISVLQIESTAQFTQSKQALLMQLSKDIDPMPLFALILPSG